MRNLSQTSQERFLRKLVIGGLSIVASLGLVDRELMRHIFTWIVLMLLLMLSAIKLPRLLIMIGGIVIPMQGIILTESGTIF